MITGAVTDDRLRDRVRVAVRQWTGCLSPGGALLWDDRERDAWKLLDALCAEQQALGAVKALEMVRCRWAIDRARLGDDPYECLTSETTGHPSAYCDRCQALAAAQAELERIRKGR